MTHVDSAELLAIAGPDIPLPATGTITVIGPGTGLGVAQLWLEDAKGYRVQATEGGHIDFAPLDAIDDILLAKLRERHRRVSVERVVAGPAIVDWMDALCTIEGRAIPTRDDRVLWKLGIEGGDNLAAAAVERICRTLGSVAGIWHWRTVPQAWWLPGALACGLKALCLPPVSRPASSPKVVSKQRCRPSPSSSSRIRSPDCLARRQPLYRNIVPELAGSCHKRFLGEPRVRAIGDRSISV